MNDEIVIGLTGSLRDYFAGQALVGLLASYPTDQNPDPAWVAKCAHEMADAMLKAREERSK